MVKEIIIFFCPFSLVLEETFKYKHFLYKTQTMCNFSYTTVHFIAAHTLVLYVIFSFEKHYTSFMYTVISVQFLENYQY